MSMLFWGSVLTVVGTLYLLQSAGILHAGFSFWPVVFLIYGVHMFLKGLIPGRFSVRRRPSGITMALGFWIGSIGLFNILYANGLTQINGRTAMGMFWPVLLVGFGLSLLVASGSRIRRPSPHRRPDSRARMKWWSRWISWLENDGVYGRTGLIVDVHFGREPWTLDGPLDLRYKVGDIRIDLTTAEITPGEHDITVTSSIGEVYVLAPASCTIRAEASVGIGSVTIFDDEHTGVSVYHEKSALAEAGAATLNIFVHLRVGSVTIRRVPGKDDREVHVG